MEGNEIFRGPEIVVVRVTIFNRFCSSINISPFYLVLVRKWNAPLLYYYFGPIFIKLLTLLCWNHRNTPN